MIALKRILFIDIETISCEADFMDLPEGMQQEWIRKAKTFRVADGSDATSAMLFSEKAAIYSEFAKIVCIGIGSLTEHNGNWTLARKVMTNDDEKTLLNHFCESIGKFVSKYPDIQFCGHNIKEFDIPFISRRMVIHGMPLPKCMNYQGKKPWEVPHIDTMELWSFGDRKNFTSLALLAQVLGIPSPKEEINGSMISDLYWSASNGADREEVLTRVGEYCLGDVETTAKVYLRLAGYTDIKLEQNIVEQPYHESEV